MPQRELPAPQPSVYDSTMYIEQCTFGKITVSDKTYTSDLIIYPERVDPSWWRRQSHALCLEDLAVVLETKPSVVIIGTGYAGMLKVPRELLSALRHMGIDAYAEKTPDAVELFKRVSSYSKTVACLHLTC